MIYGIGSDIVNISRFEKILTASYASKFINRVFTESEIAKAEIKENNNYQNYGITSRLPPPGTKGARGGYLSSSSSTNTFPPLNPPPPAVGETSNVHSCQQTRETRTNARLKAAFYAKRFAAREAFVKALGTGFSTRISWRDVSVSNDASGRPCILLSDSAYEHALSITGGAFQTHLSLSDDYPMAQSFVIICLIG